MNKATKTIPRILKDNICTVFNLLNLLIAVMLAYVGAFKNLLFITIVMTNTVVGIIQEIKAKKLEQGELIDESAEEGKDDKKDTEKNKEKEVIPSLIVRLRGKHSTKYLCSYSFTEVENNSEKIRD